MSFNLQNDVILEDQELTTSIDCGQVCFCKTQTDKTQTDFYFQFLGFLHPFKMLNSIFFFHGGRTIQYDPERNQFLVVIDIRLTDVALIQSVGVYIWQCWCVAHTCVVFCVFLCCA